MGRPKGTVSLTPRKIKLICGHIANGLFFNQACRLSAVSVFTATQWLRYAKDDPDNYPLCVKLVAAIEEAEAEFERKHLANINFKSREDWKASAWALERKWPERYGRNRLELVGENGGAVKVEQAAQVVLYIPDNGRDGPAEPCTTPTMPLTETSAE